MKTKTRTYVKTVPVFLFFFLLITSNSLLAQTQYEGFGAGAVGGSNSSTVYHVTNLNSSGAGSLANGIGSNRTIVFDVSGTITGRFDLINISYLTIDATGQDITINGNNNGDAISFDGANTHHCILKGVHVTNPGNDCINVIDGAHDIVITNCTAYGSRDGNIDVANDSRNVTVQYCILGNGNTGWSGAMLITSTNVSVHHNLFIPATSGQVGERCPFVHANYSTVGSPNADIRNNVIYKWGRNAGSGSGYGTSIAYNATGNVVNNYYYSNASPGSAVNSDDGYGSGATGKVFASGNVSGNSGVNPNSVSNHAEYTIPAAASINMQDACTAANLVLANAGPSPRNSVDLNFINSVTLTGCSSTPPANQSPTANAGIDITLTLPTNSTTLTGSGSDPDGTIASYAWSRVSGPTTFTLGSSNAATTSLTNLVQGTYVFRLTVTDNSGATGTDNITVTVNAAANQSPTANAGTDITLTLPTNSTTLTGSGSDPDGTIASYAWSRVSGPTTFTLGSANAATTSLTNLVQGTYVFRLTVTDNSGATGTDNITVTVNAAANQSPTANAGVDITMTLPINSTVLTGTGSDPDGTIAGYAWSRVSGPTTFTFGSANSASTALSNLVQGVYVFRLTVTDNGGATATDNITVTVNAAANQAPTANAGSNITLTLPTNSTTLNGSGSDPDGTIASYAWSRVSGPATYTFGSANSATTTVSNLVQGVYIFRLTVTDNNGATGTANVTVTVNPAGNIAPNVNAGADITLTLPTNSTTLSGTATDPDGTIASYSWSKVSGPTTFTLTNPGTPTTNLTGLVQGIYIFRLSVTDNSGAVSTDDVKVTVNAAANQAPTARAGNDITITLPTNSTTLNGSSSSDADGVIVSYQWSRVSGPTTYTLTSAGSAATGLTNLVQGVYVFRLTVTDDNGATGTDDITVTVNSAGNQAPVANAGNDITITLPVNSTNLIGSGSDPDGTIVSYNWTRVSGPATYTLGNANAASTTLTNLVQGVYVFRLTVTDNSGATGTDNVTVVVNAANPPSNQPPTANAGNDITITLPTNSTTLNGSGNDPDGTIVSYNWTKVSGPTMFLVANGSSATTALSNLVQGVYVFKLTVIDNYGATASDNVTITVNAAPAGPNQSPVARATFDSIVLILPINSTTLNGTPSTDPDGTIEAYEWTQQSGPSQATINNTTSANAQLLNLGIGVYYFTLKVTDNDGATNTKTIKVIVKNKDNANIYFNIYPNPTNGPLTVKYINNDNGKVRLSVYDATRRLMKDAIVDKTQAVMTEQLDVTNLDNGVYIIQVVLPDGKILAKQLMKL